MGFSRSPTAKVSYFFFLIKFMGHSFNQIVKLCIFFKGVFFSQKKFMRHSFRIWWVFLYFFLKVGCVFFSSHFWVFFVCFFLPVKVHMPFIHSISGLYFFSVAGKKYSFFIHLIDFSAKCGKK